MWVADSANQTIRLLRQVRPRETARSLVDRHYATTPSPWAIPSSVALLPPPSAAYNPKLPPAPSSAGYPPPAPAPSSPPPRKARFMIKDDV